MTDAKSTALQDKLAARREAYRDALPNRLAEIASCWDRIRHGSGDVATMRRLVHNIAGSAGTFGFSALGDKARELEQILSVRASSAQAEFAADIGNLLADMRSQVEKQETPGLAGRGHAAPGD
jgi:HPt (histidine-containing phosphotransfer) domain-containing protein